jgi:hypothetical protein
MKQNVVNKENRMIDPIKILRRAWHILWSYRALWVFGLILALAAGSSTGNRGNNNNAQWREESPYQGPSYDSPRDFFNDVGRQINRLLEQGIPDWDISGQALSAFLWVIGVFILVMVIVGIVMAIARYVSETAVIRMVDEYESTGNKITVRQGWRSGWSRSAWRLFLINLIVNLPAITLSLVLLVAGIVIFFAVVNDNVNLQAFSIVSAIVIGFITLFVVVILSILLHLLRNFFWRICVLEDASVSESLQRGFALVLENWKNVGLMWLVMIGLGIVWTFASVILVVISIPLVAVTAVIALLVFAVPYLLLVGLFSTFLTGVLPWIAGGLFIAPLFFPLAFSPWVLLGSWQAVYTSSVWTLTYREIKALPALTASPQVEPTAG